MSSKKRVFKMVPGEELSKGFGNNVYWPEFSLFQSVKKVKLVQLGKEDETIELPIRLCGNNILGDTFYCIRNEEGNTLKGSFSRDKPCYTKNSCAFVYYNDMLVKLSMKSYSVDCEEGCSGTLRNDIKSERSKYIYVTQEELSDTYKYYFSDYQGNIVNSPDNQALQYIGLDVSEETVKNILSKIPENIILSKVFAKIFVGGLTEDQLETLTHTLSEVQIENLVKHLTDNQWKTLVSHLTNHQLHILAYELNPEKLQIIIPILNDDQLGALVRELNPEQVREILPHLKVDQFKALINNIDDYQLVELAKDLDEHHLTILSKELWSEQLPALVHTLEGDRLHNLINKLDHDKLAIVARDLTDSNKIQIIIKSLADNPDKLQAFARNMSNEQFKELLDNLGAGELKDIIHKLPHEKVISVIGDLGSKGQSNAIIDALKEKFNEQNEKMKELLDKVDRMIPEESEANWNDAHPSTYVFQDMNTEFAIIDNLL
ncbi:MULTISPECIES: magnesium and cobalt transport protein CorA [unclassified Wolbachia]|uniref:MgtE intracellular N domain protein n=1 Tax=unclassified Wolbachia TaxID=2640676 RepID=UPI001BD51633|nr:MgtE intracellular N domain protein [Wolbachia endosymbiont of Rhagoletis cerasi]MBS9531460.1 MgtE intracellular N domain protein [Wolbachia endosymbiont of Rhagoletis cerasi]